MCDAVVVGISQTQLTLQIAAERAGETVPRPWAPSWRDEDATQDFYQLELVMLITSSSAIDSQLHHAAMKALRRLI